MDAAMTAPAARRDEQPEFAGLRQLLEEQTEHIDALVTRLEVLHRREAELRALLVEANHELVRRDDAVAGLQAQLVQLQAQLAQRDLVIEARDEGIAWLRGELELHQRLVAERDEGIAWLRGQLRGQRPVLALWDEHLRTAGAAGFVRGQLGRVKRRFAGQFSAPRSSDG